MRTAGQGRGIYTGDDGYLYCDDVRVEDCRKVRSSLLSRTALQPQQYALCQDRAFAGVTL